MDLPSISVIIPAFNASRTIDRALSSVWRQDYAPLEVIVIDDGSADDLSAAVAPHLARGVQFIRLDKNVGECGATNKGIRAAAGEFIAFLDADDEWLDSKLHKQMAILAAHPDMTFITSGFHVVDHAGMTVEKGGLADTVQVCPEFWRDLLVSSQVAKPCVVARKSCVIEVGGFDEALPVAGDQDMWIKLSLLGEVGFLREDLVRVHITAGRLTERYAAREMEFLLPVILKHLKRQKSLLSRREIKRILSRRYTAIGRNAYVHGPRVDGAMLLLRALALGYRPLENLWYLASASPPAKKLKQLLGR